MMDWYFGNDFLVPSDQDLLVRHSSPEACWSNWGMSPTEGFNSPKSFLIMDFIDQSFNNQIEFESSLRDKDQASSTSNLCAGFPDQSVQPTAVSCDQPNYQLQDLPLFQHMDHIFLDSVPEEDLHNVENLNKPFNISPDNQCISTTGQLKQDIAASKFVTRNSKSEYCQDIEAPPVNVLDSFESRDEGMHSLSSLEEFILKDLEMVIGQFNEKTRLCFRDALYRLARNNEQQHVLQDKDRDPNMPKGMPQMVHNETVRSQDKKPMELETNNVDRVIANLMFKKMEFDINGSPTSSLKCKQEITGSNDIKQGKSSEAFNLAQKFHYPKRDGEVPWFGLCNQQRDTDSHIAYGEPTKKSFMLEFG